jgi:hypothetical protein
MPGVVSQLCGEVKLPKMLKVRQHFDPSSIEKENIPKAVFNELAKPTIADTVKPGKRIAITCGSRGVDNIAVITKSIADFVKSKGAFPFIVPAMGSHGGATAEGQKALIAGYGVTEEFCGCPVLSSMETVVIGKTEAEEGEASSAKQSGYEVRIDKYASESGGIIVAGRIKPHTDYHGTYESGIMKMMAIGLGKREGADICHQLGFGQMARMVKLFGKAVIKNAPVIFGFGILENAYSQVCKFAAMLPFEIEEKEPQLLEEARSHLPFIPFDSTDVLVIDKIGKDISGDGMDPNITGNSHCSPFVKGGIAANRTVVLDLTDETHGTAFGMGAAHAVTKRLFNKIDFDSTYVNAITSRGLDFVRLPLIADNDREAVQAALRTCIGHDKDNPQIIRIADSLHTETFYISQAMESEAVKKGLEILEGPEDWQFNKEGNLW